MSAQEAAPGDVEHWKKIPGYPDYEVSDQGRVRSWIDHMARVMSPPLPMPPAMGRLLVVATPG